MADVIRAALDAHQPGWKDGGVMCRGCCWRFVPDKDGWQEDVDRHLADVVRDVVLEVVGQVHAEHRPVDLDDCSCDDQDEGTYAEHLDAMVAAALAGED